MGFVCVWMREGCADIGDYSKGEEVKSSKSRGTLGPEVEKPGRRGDRDPLRQEGQFQQLISSLCSEISCRVATRAGEYLPFRVWLVLTLLGTTAGLGSESYAIATRIAHPSTSRLNSMSEGRTIGGQTTLQPLVSKYGKDLSKMDIAMAQNVDIKPLPGQSSDFVSPDMNSVRSSRVEEDDSSQSSSGTELFDRNSANSSSKKGNWKLDINGNWRYGSSDSATSTGVSSACSSVVADDKSIDKPDLTSLSKKRMSDGSLKPPLIRISSVSQTSASKALVPEQAEQQAPTPEQNTPKKRRGRPPKDKTAVPTSAAAVPKRMRRASEISKLHTEVRPRSSIPYRLPANVFASQCIDAAHSSRLSPFALHVGEHALLVDLLTTKEVTIYLNIRNAILRLWTQNPLCAVTPEEAAGCAKESRFFGLAEIAYKWLVRNGYINFGCVEVPRDIKAMRSNKNGKQKTVVVIGAGVSGLTTARQLENLFAQDSAKWTDQGERPPRVIVLEGRRRIGGRVYSKPIRDQVPGSLPNDLRNTVEMGAMIVTGFEHGNPLDTIIRGQLGLRYHLMRDALTIYDCDGKPINEHRDMLTTELYTDVSDRTGDFRAAPQEMNTLKGDEELISRCRDPVPDGYEDFQLEPLFDPLNKLHKPITKRGRRRNAPPGTEKITGKSRIVESSNATQSAARAAKSMGWQLKEGVAKNQSISLHKLAKSSAHPTLGSIMDEAIEQYQDLIELKPQDMRLLNWHHANLEYANAAPVSSLSLSGHDQDNGNEFEGAHSEIVGGYTQMPRGLMNVPTKLDVRFDRIVDSIHYNDEDYHPDEYTTKVVCTNGEVIEADEVVVTVPLGILKARTIDFDPPLPNWKQGAIERMGFGLLNKVILIYDRPFWDDERDMFGLLNDAEVANSVETEHYARRRGRFYLLWNASKISGRPALVALMAGNAAHDTETTDTKTLLSEIDGRLRKVFAKSIPAPQEVIVTRWKRDPFTRGTYSYVGPRTRPEDYDSMAHSVGNLHFAGEATCGTHPATVHGAFLSGLRVASEVMDSLAGAISLPRPLVGPAAIKQETQMRPPIPASYAAYPPVSVAGPMNAEFGTETTTFIKEEPDTIVLANVPPFGSAATQQPPSKKLAGPPRQSVCAGDASFWVAPSVGGGDLDYEARIVAAILSQIGDRPIKPARPGVNPFLLFTKAKWDECKIHCGRDSATAGRDAIRTTLGKWWKAASNEEKQPYIDQSQSAQESADAARKEWAEKSAQWEADAKRIREEYVRDNPPPADSGVSTVAASMGGVGVSKRKTNVSNCVVLDHA